VSRISKAFAGAREDGRTALVTYLMAGDPDGPRSAEYALACIRGGADVVELGIPFSDPIADGPVIQAAGQRALAAGMTPIGVLEVVRGIRKESDVPIALMTYLNPVLAAGEQRFCQAAKEAGVDGLIVPDLPIEEAAPLGKVAEDAGIDLIQLVAPSTSVERAERIASASRGFLYVVARYGTTGVQDDIPEDLPEMLRAFKEVSHLPLAVGFGVSTAEHVKQLHGAGADGVVVGSALVRAVGEGGNVVGRLEEVVRGLGGGG